LRSRFTSSHNELKLATEKKIMLAHTNRSEAKTISRIELMGNKQQQKQHSVQVKRREEEEERFREAAGRQAKNK
jgi:hypothetical protein